MNFFFKLLNQGETFPNGGRGIFSLMRGAVPSLDLDPVGPDLGPQHSNGYLCWNSFPKVLHVSIIYHQVHDFFLLRKQKLLVCMGRPLNNF